MATGDLYNNLERLRLELRALRYDGPFDVRALAVGEPAAFLPLLHHAFLGHSAPVAGWLAASGYELYSKSDLRFVELLFRIARVEFGYRHSLTPAQMLTAGFAERKALFAVDMLRLTAAKADDLAREAGVPTATAARSPCPPRAGTAAACSTAIAFAPSSKAASKENASTALVHASGDCARTPSPRAQEARQRLQHWAPQPQPLALSNANLTAAGGVAKGAPGAAGGERRAAQRTQRSGHPAPSSEQQAQQPAPPADALSPLLHALESRLLASLDGVSARLGAQLENGLGEVGARLSLLEGRLAHLEGRVGSLETDEARAPAALATQRDDDGTHRCNGRGLPHEPRQEWQPLSPRPSWLAGSGELGHDARDTSAAEAGPSYGERAQRLEALATQPLSHAPAAHAHGGQRAAQQPQQPQHFEQPPAATAPPPPPPFGFLDPSIKASPGEYLRHLERRFEATEALVSRTLTSTAALAQLGGGGPRR